MKIVRIFVSENSEDGLWSIHLMDALQNEFDKFFDLMNNPEWLYGFFEKNSDDLISGFFGNNLQHLFKPLNNFEYAITIHQKSKARIKRSWLRLYAVRLAKNCYLVTGGAIKLTLDMQREHLQVELNKLERVRIFLRDNGIAYPDDLNTYQDA